VNSAINGQPALTFDGVSQRIVTASFALAQPFTCWIVAKSITWGSGHYIFTDATISSGHSVLYQNGVTPQIDLFCAVTDILDNHLAVGSFGVVETVHNGASSKLVVGTNTPSTGNPGTGGFQNGISLGGLSGGTQLSNVAIAEFIVFDHSQSGSPDETAVLNGLRGWYNL
jgi:hypothetical protein